MKIVEQYNGDPPSLFVRSFLVTFSDAADLDEHTRRESILDGLPDLGHAHPSDESLVCNERWLSMIDPLRMQAVCQYGESVKAKGVGAMKVSVAVSSRVEMDGQSSDRSATVDAEFEPGDESPQLVVARMLSEACEAVDDGRKAIINPCPCGKCEPKANA